MKRNLKLLNHWIAELREIASNYGIMVTHRFDKEPVPISKNEIKWYFSIERFEDEFINGKTPQQAFDDNIDSLYD